VTTGPTVPVVTTPERLVLLARSDPLPRAAVVYSARALDDPGAVMAALRAPGFAPAREVLLLGGAPLPADATTPPATPARIVHEEPDRLEIAVTAERAAYLVLADAFYPGWRAEVDGQPAPVLRANYAFRAVAVPAGASTVRLIFDPPLWRLGWLLALPAALVTLLLLLLPGRWLPRRPRAGVGTRARSDRR
jgi:hypothetical protein